jgi:hypothetical protein
VWHGTVHAREWISAPVSSLVLGRVLWLTF